MATKIAKCDCEHEFQDAKHGKDNRVHNKAKSNGNQPMWRCTVCGKVKNN